MKRFLIVVILLGFSFAAGYFPTFRYQKEVKDLQQQLMEARRSTDRQVAEIQAQVKVLQLHSQLGMFLLEVQQSNFGNARERSSRFFDNLAEVTSSIGDSELGKKLIDLGRRRDQITTGLATADAETASKVRDLYQEFAAAAGVR